MQIWHFHIIKFKCGWKPVQQQDQQRKFHFKVCQVLNWELLNGQAQRADSRLTVTWDKNSIACNGRGDQIVSIDSPFLHRKLSN